MQIRVSMASSTVFLDFNWWIYKIMLTWNAIAAFSLQRFQKVADVIMNLFNFTCRK